MNQLCKQLATYNSVKNLFYEPKKMVGTKRIFADLLSAFITWAEDKMSMEAPEFKHILTFSKDLFEAHCQQDAIFEFDQYIKSQGFYCDIVADHQEYKIHIALRDPEETKKLIAEYKNSPQMKRLQDPLLSAVVHKLSKIFQKHCCQENQESFEHPKYEKFASLCDNIFKIKYPKEANRKDKSGYNVEACHKIEDAMGDLILFSREFGDYSIIEAFKKGQEDTLKIPSHE